MNKDNQIVILNTQVIHIILYLLLIAEGTKKKIRKELEDVKELALGAPFITYNLKRNKYEDNLSSFNDLFEAFKDKNNKIIKRFQPIKRQKKVNY